jgi:hypothetical protein
MSSSEPNHEVLPRFCAGELSISLLQSAHPTDQVGTVEKEPPAGRRRDGIREGLRKGPALQINICAGVSHGRVEPGVPEPLTDRGEINAGLEERYRGAV